LAMSRSLGDLSFRPYVISQPELRERQLNHKDKVIILGSDGVWDRMAFQEAVRRLGKLPHVDWHRDPIGHVEELGLRQLLARRRRPPRRRSTPHAGSTRRR